MESNGLPPGFTLDQSQPQPSGDDGSSAPLPQGFQLDDDKYGSVGQQALAGVEGVAKGLAGPLATGAEVALGVSPQSIRGRAEANPVTHGLSEAAGLAGGAFFGSGEAAVLGKIGEGASAAAKAAGLVGETGLISKIASHGIQTGAEMAALQTGDEVSKMITQDPGQSIGTAAMNVGLAGILGGAGGAAIGTVSPLWKAIMEKTGLPKIIDDAKAQYGFRQGLKNGGDVPAAITDELSTRLNEVDAMREQMSNLKGNSLARAMPEVSDANTEKINGQIQDISKAMTDNITKASDNAYLKASVPKLEQDFKDFLGVVNDPEATYADKFSAIDDLKRAQQAKSKYNLTAEDTALGNFTKGIGHDLRLSLEDSSVWGDAANVQKQTNAAIKATIDAEKDAAGKFTQKSALEGGRIVDPAKVNTLVNQSLKGKAGLKGDFIGKYIDQTDKLADTINKIHTDAGLEAPIRLTPAPALSHTLGNSSPGTTLGNWLFDKGLATAAGDTGGAALGGGLGTIVGHPALGAVIGERVLSPTLTSLAKPLLENATRSEAAKASIDYVVNVIKGEKLLGNAAKSFFTGSEVLPKDFIPNSESRKRLEDSLNAKNDINGAIQTGGELGHYLPGHATAAATTAATAVNYFRSLKPTQSQSGPLDKPTPISKLKDQQYNRALDIAQQPLMVLKHAQNGTLQAQDVRTLNTLYPEAAKKITKQLYDQMLKAKAEGKAIPYAQRQSLSLLMGMPLDSTLSQSSMATVMQANAPRGAPPQPQGKTRKVSRSTSSTMEKVNQMYSTPEQSRAADRSQGSR